MRYFNIHNKRILKKAGAVLFWIAIWAIIYVAVGDGSEVIASPISVIGCILRLICTFDFWSAIILSLTRISIGFALSILFSVVLSVLAAQVLLFRLLFESLFSIIRAIPVVVLILIISVHMDSAIIPMFVAFFSVLPIVWGNIYRGIVTVDVHLLEMARVFRVRGIDIARKIYVPHIAPYFTSAVSSAVGFAFKSGISAEVIVKSGISIGEKISLAKANMQLPELFAWTVIMVIMCSILEKLTALIATRIFDTKKDRDIQ